MSSTDVAHHPGVTQSAYWAATLTFSFAYSADALQRDASRVVERCPGIVAAEDQVGEQHAGDRSVRHAVARIAGDHVDVVGIERVVADERKAVDRLHHLSAPLVFDLTHHRETLARPAFEPRMPFVDVVGLSALVILAADDQQIVGRNRSPSPAGCSDTDRRYPSRAPS